jgi:hypothetical protein
VAAGSETRCEKSEEGDGPVLRGRCVGGSSKTPKRGRIPRALPWEWPSAWEEGPRGRFHRSSEGNLRGQNPRRAPASGSINHRFGGDESQRRRNAQKSSPARLVAAPAVHTSSVQRQVGSDRREAARLSFAGEALKGETQERSSSETWGGDTDEAECVKRAEKTLEAQYSGGRQSPRQ